MKKFILTTALAIALISPAYAEPDCCSAKCEVIEMAEVVEADELTAVQPEDAEAVPESNIAKRMTQAEKAKNAAENDSWGGAITIIAMGIVISALVVLSILFLIFGKISEKLLAKKKRISHSGSQEATAVAAHHEVDSGEAIAAIAMALSEHFGDGHDMEDTILTIKRMKRAYSPWNSKIYNLRQVPELNRNPRR